MFNISRGWWVLAALILASMTFTALVIMQPVFSAQDVQRFVSPYIQLNESELPMNDLHSIAFAEIDNQIVGEPTLQKEYLVTKGQWLTYAGLNMPSSILPDRQTPFYIIRVEGEFDLVTADGYKSDTMEVAIDIAEGRVFATSIGISSLMPEIDVDITDSGYPEPLAPEVIEAHQFRSTPIPAEDRQVEPLPLPHGPNE